MSKNPVFDINIHQNRFFRWLCCEFDKPTKRKGAHWRKRRAQSSNVIKKISIMFLWLSWMRCEEIICMRFRFGFTAANRWRLISMWLSGTRLSLWFLWKNQGSLMWLKKLTRNGNGRNDGIEERERDRETIRVRSLEALDQRRSGTMFNQIFQMVHSEILNILLDALKS